jgi:glycosyltransferase involved in cell wall biosynthesis
MLAIGFDAKRLFNNVTGLGNYGRTLVRGLQELYPENEYVLFSPQLTKNDQTAFFLSQNFKQKTSGAVPGALWRSFFLSGEIRRSKMDLFHGLSNELPAGIEKTGVKSVVTVHDLIFRFYKEDYPWVDRAIYDAKFRYACENADRIVAVSESTKNDIVTQYAVPKEKIAVVYQACDERFRREVPQTELEAVRSTYGLPPRYLLYVGTVNRRKNLLSLVQAMKELRGKSALPLVVVGNGKEYLRIVRKYAEGSGLRDRIVFMPLAAPDDLPAIYRGAAVFIYPSRYEGFGLPVVEALLSRVPVITSRVSSLPEAAGPGARYIDPENPSSITEGITEILSSPVYARQLAEDGFRHAQQFNPADCSRKMMAVYQETLQDLANK